MRKLFSTAEVHPRDRFDFWHSVACKALLDHDSLPEKRHDFSAVLESGRLGEISVVRFENSPMSVTRTLEQAARANPDEFLVCRQEAGSFVLEQESRSVALSPGDLMLLDPRLPHKARFVGASRMLVLKIPRRQLAARIGGLREMSARRLAPGDAETAMMSAYLSLLPAQTDCLAPGTAEIVAGHALDLLALALGSPADGPPPVSSARSVIRLKVRGVVEARLGDPRLDADTVAAAVGASVRYVNAVLAEENTSIMRLVQARRLARCRMALEDPMQSHRTVSEIVYGWGFSDMTHFGRRFKAAYGTLPSESRRRGRNRLD